MDNVAISSADRLLHGNYEAIRDDRVFEEAVDIRSAAASIILHDLVNLASLLESLFCFDEIYVNAQFIDRWNQNIGSGLLAGLDGVVTGVSLSRDDQWQAESAIVRDPRWREMSSRAAVDELASLVFTAMHCRRGTNLDGRQSQRLLSPYDEETRPFQQGVGIAVGAGFYTMCSDALDVPYRPSAVRARMLRDMLGRELAAWRFQAGAIALDLLEKSRRQAAEKYFTGLSQTNVIEPEMPAILGSVLQQARSIEEVVPYVMQLRNSPEAREFREWSREMSKVIMAGEVREIAKMHRAVNKITERVNRRLRIAPQKKSSIQFAFGPIAVGGDLPLPSVFNTPIHIKRHFWLLQKIYETIANSARLSDNVNRLIVPGLPAWLSKLVDGRPIIYPSTDRS